MSHHMANLAVCVLLCALSSGAVANDRSALDAVKASAEAARMAAEAAASAAEAASIAADAAHMAVSGRPAPVAATTIATPNSHVKGTTPDAPAPALASGTQFVPPNPFVQQAAEDLAAAQARNAVLAAASAATANDGATRVYTRQDIEQSGDVTLADFLRRQSSNIGGSLTPTLGSNVSAAALAGTRALGAERTVVLLNGRRIAASVLADGTLANNLTTLPLVALERIEILPDGLGAMLGEDAVGGAINLVTREGFSGLSASAGLAETRDGLALNEHYSLVAGHSGEATNLMLAAERTEQQIPDRINGLINDANLDRDSVHLQADAALGPNLTAYAQATAGRATVSADNSDKTLANEEFGNAVGGLRVATDALGGLALDASAGQSRTRNAPADSVIQSTTRLDTVRAQLDIEGLKIPGLQLPIFLGGEKRRLRTRGLFDAQRDVDSLFGGAGLQLFNALRLDYRQREDRLGEDSAWLRSQRYSASLALLPGLRVHGAYATGFGLASLGETTGATSLSMVEGVDYALCEKLNPGAIVLDGDGRPMIAPNLDVPAGSPCRPQFYNALTFASTNLTPERSEHWRAGISFNARPVALTLSAYRVDIDALTQGPNVDDTFVQEWLLGASAGVTRDSSSQVKNLTLLSRNAGRLTTQGAEAEFRLGSYLDADMPLGVRIVANYIDEFLQSSLDELAPAPGADVLLPRLRTSVDLRYAPIEQATLLLTANFIDEAATPDRQRLIEEWFTVDAQLSLALPWHGALTFGVRNLLDQAPPEAFGFDAPYYDNRRYRATGFAPYLRYRQSL